MLDMGMGMGLGGGFPGHYTGPSYSSTASHESPSRRVAEQQHYHHHHDNPPVAPLGTCLPGQIMFAFILSSAGCAVLSALSGSDAGDPDGGGALPILGAFLGAALAVLGLNVYKFRSMRLPQPRKTIAATLLALLACSATSGRLIRSVQRGEAEEVLVRERMRLEAVIKGERQDRALGFSLVASAPDHEEVKVGREGQVGHGSATRFSDGEAVPSVSVATLAVGGGGGGGGGAGGGGGGGAAGSAIEPVPASSAEIAKRFLFTNVVSSMHHSVLARSSKKMGTMERVENGMAGAGGGRGAGGAGGVLHGVNGGVGNVGAAHGAFINGSGILHSGGGGGAGKGGGGSGGGAAAAARGGEGSEDGNSQRLRHHTHDEQTNMQGRRQASLSERMAAAQKIADAIQHCLIIGLLHAVLPVIVFNLLAEGDAVLELAAACWHECCTRKEDTAGKKVDD